MKKNICAVILSALLMILSFGGLPTHPVNASAKDIYDTIKDPNEANFIELLKLLFGSGDYSIGYEPGNECEDIGPEDFIIDGDTIILLDSVNRAVKYFVNSSLTKNIDISYAGYPMFIAKTNGMLYVFDCCLECVFEINENSGTLIQKLPLPIGFDCNFAIDFIAKNGAVYLVDSNYNAFDILNPNHAPELLLNISANNNIITWSARGNNKQSTFNDVYVRFIGNDADGNSFFSVYHPVMNTCVVLGETTLECYSAGGKLVGVARLSTEQNTYTPAGNLFLSDSGDIYCIECPNNQVCVYKINLGTI